MRKFIQITGARENNLKNISLNVQRDQLAAELLKPATGSPLYIMDGPTTGLHTADVYQLINII
ncbi:hypothetical protein CCZ20_28395 [Priestia aryabhattai]|uniref:hypothetical protein n=1 Tax=Priestia aryabhattai TaxID=412384 RepID=UPI000B50C711|nr:hypothetical protein [Priestia aryabhattai]OVE34083.1 hypothetical protein CCZ20_28395 [Priestia aryabhattai]